MTDDAENGCLTPTSAIATALAAADDVAIRSYGYDVVARESEGQTVELRLIRMLGKCSREHATKVSRAMPNRMFADACRRAWTFLKLEHDRAKKPGEY